jgi:hypothetical protein
MGEIGCLKDGNFQNLQVEGTTTLVGSAMVLDDPFVEKTRAVAVAAGNVTAVNGDFLIISNAAPGDITLPAAKQGSKVRMFFKIGNTTTFTITAPGVSGKRYDVLSTISQEDKAADTANTFGDIPVAADNTLTITAAGIGSMLTFVSDGTTYFVFGELTAIDGTPGGAAFTTA